MPRPLLIKPLPSAEHLRELLNYNPQTGALTWKSRAVECFREIGKRPAEYLHQSWNTKYAGKAAGSVRRDGYATVVIDGEHYKLHRVIWKIATGEEPQQIDHINRDQGDNRFENLRDVAPKINSRNRGMWSHNTSGVTGIEFHSRDEVWTAKLGLHGKQIYLGSFKTRDEAIAARLASEVVRDHFESRETH